MRSNKDPIQIPNELFERIDFIGREKELENIKSKMNKSSTHIMMLSGFAGTGKSCLVNEYGHQIKGNDYIVRWIAGYEIADLFNTEEKLEILEIYQRIASESVGFVFFTTNNSHYIRYALHFVNALF